MEMYSMLINEDARNEWHTREYNASTASSSAYNSANCYQIFYDNFYDNIVCQQNLIHY